MGLDTEVREIVQELGADLYGVADLGYVRQALAEESTGIAAGYPRAISLGIVLNHAIIDLLPHREERAIGSAYRLHCYDVINGRLDVMTSRLAGSLQARGFQALPVPASVRCDDRTIRAIFSHKMAAHLAGLGWIGKSCLLVTPEHGPRVRWTTVLTDAHLAITGEPIGERCGACEDCVRICPVEAFAGRAFRPDEPREARYDARACQDYLRRLEEENPWGICGLCVYVCPHGLHRSERIGTDSRQ